MHKRIWLALVLVLALVVSSSCSLIAKDESVELAATVLEVDGRAFTKGELNEMTQYYLDYNAYLAEYYYGMTYDTTSDAAWTEAQQMALDYLTQTAIVDAKLAEYGFDTLAEEEMAEIEASAKEEYDSYYQMIDLFVMSSSELTGDERKAAIEAEMVNYGFPTYDTLVEDKTYSLKTEKLVKELTKDITVSGEDVAAEYTARVEADKAAYTADPAQYGTAVLNGVTPYYAPAGYRTVKHILVTFNDEDQAKIDELQLTISEKQADASEEELEQLNADLAAAQETAYANLQPVVDEINAKLAEGADFDALITEYNQDPGMTDGREGYLVSAENNDWVTEFKDAAMALGAAGDVSEAVRSSYGIHIIRYQSDVAEGEIGLETVRETLTEEVLANKQTTHINDLMTEWMEAAEVEVHEKELKRK